MANEGIKSLSILDKDYLQWIKELSTRFRRSQVKASVRVNQVMLQFYWELEKFYPEKVEGTIPTIEEIEAKLSAR